MAQGYSKVSDLNSLFNSLYEDTVFVARERVLMPALVTNYTGKGVATRYLGIYPQVTAQEVAESVAFASPTLWNKTELMQITPKTEMTQVILSDERLETDPEDAMRSSASEMGAAIAHAIDTDLLSVFSSFDTDKGTAGSAFTIKRVAAAIAVLRNSNVDNPIQVVCHPYGWYDVWTQLGQPEATQAFLGELANQALKDYFAGRWLSANWYTSSNIAVSATTDDAVAGVFHRDSIALDTRRPITMETERDADRRSWKVNMHAWYGYNVRRSDYGVAITHDATEPTGV